MKKNIISIQFSNYCFTPTLFPSLMVIFLLPLLVYLGFWQIHRGDSKNQIQKIFYQRSVAIPINLNQIENINNIVENSLYSATSLSRLRSYDDFFLKKTFYMINIKKD